MLRPRQLLTYFGHNSFCFLSFQNSRQTCSGGQGGGRQGGGRQGGGRQGGGRQGGGGVSHIGAGIILSASCSFALFYFMFKVVFIVSVHGLEFNRSECMYLIL